MFFRRIYVKYNNGENRLTLPVFVPMTIKQPFNRDFLYIFIFFILFEAMLFFSYIILFMVEMVEFAAALLRQYRIYVGVFRFLRNKLRKHKLF